MASTTPWVWSSTSSVKEVDQRLRADISPHVSVTFWDFTGLWRSNTIMSGSLSCKDNWLPSARPRLDKEVHMQSLRAAAQRHSVRMAVWIFVAMKR